MQPKKGINMFAIGLLVVCILFGAFGQIFMKAGMNQLDKIDDMAQLLDPDTAMSILKNKYVIGGLLLYAISAFLWLGALSTLDVSFMYPMLSLAYVITAILAFVSLGENITVVRWAGIVLVVAGCFLIARS